jgi:hypothetical protein
MTYTCGKTATGRIRREIFLKPVVMGSVPSHEEIARTAYGYWEARGRQGGSADEDWYRAERELWGRLGRTRH